MTLRCELTQRSGSDEATALRSVGAARKYQLVVVPPLGLAHAALACVAFLPAADAAEFFGPRAIHVVVLLSGTGLLGVGATAVLLVSWVAALVRPRASVIGLTLAWWAAAACMTGWGATVAVAWWIDR